MRWVARVWSPRRIVSGVGMLMSDGLVAILHLAVVVSAVTFVASTLFVFPVAVLFLLGTLLLVGPLARLERSRFAAILGVSISAHPSRATDGSPWQRFLAVMKDGTRWRELGYVVGQSLWGLIAFAIGLILWAPPAAVLLYALTDGWATGRAPTVWLVAGYSPLVWTVLCIASVLCLAVVAPIATAALTRVDHALARRLLTPPEVGDPRRVAAAAEAGRAAAVAAADAERRRIERDLHDGAQQRLIAVALELGQAQAALPNEPDRARALIDHTHGEVKGVLADLRDLVRGLRPVILEDRGLDAALSAVVARCPFPVAISVDVDPRPAAAVESAAYFVVTEALTNAMRHADPSRATVTVRRIDDLLSVEVTDDGRGGAHIGDLAVDGSGLAGVSDRTRSLGGTVTIDSPVGGPTRIRMELPCAS